MNLAENGADSRLAILSCPWRAEINPQDLCSIELPGVPLGSFSGSNYDEVVLDLKAGDLFVFCSGSRKD